MYDEVARTAGETGARALDYLFMYLCYCYGPLYGVLFMMCVSTRVGWDHE